MSTASPGRTTWSDRIGVATVLFGALMQNGIAGPAAGPTRTLAAALAALFFVALQAPTCLAERGTSRGILRIAAALLLLALLPYYPGPTEATLALALLVGAVRRRALASLEASLAFAALGTVLATWIPWGTSVGARLATGLGDLAGIGPPGGHLDLGPSAAGVPAFLWCGIVLIARAGHWTGRRDRVIGWLACLALPCVLAGQWWLRDRLHNRFGFYVSHEHAADLFRHLDFSVPVLCGVVGLGFGGGRPTWPARSGRWLAAGIPGAVIGALALLLISGWRAQQPADRRVAFLNVGGFDWDRPSIDRLGVLESGMFGLLPLHLERAGWEVSALDETELTQLDRQHAQVLVVINCQRTWSDTERAGLDAFVRSGGSLLILGDHTDVFGLMRGLNTLLPDFGMRLNFDSAYHTGKSWSDDLEWKPGLTCGWRDPVEAGISIGASLSVRPPARPLIVARYGFGDAGIRDNAAGAFLGDYKYQTGERLGDLVLVAGARRCDGRVVVYGDTSGFQNLSLTRGFFQHVLGLMDDLARPSGFSLSFALETALALVVLLVGAVGVFRPGLASLPALSATVLLGSALLASCRAPREPRDVDLGDVLLIDESHVPDTGHYSADHNFILPLVTAGLRTGLGVFSARSWSPPAIDKARVIALIAPALPLDRTEVEQLVRAMERGATVIAAASADDTAGLAPLLAAQGIAIASTHLGLVPGSGVQDTATPRFLDASPLVVREGRAETPLYTFGGHRLATALPVGAGWLIVVGDTRFFSQRNVEGEWGWWPGNVRFLYDLFLTYCGGQAGPRTPLLPAPRHPDRS